MKLILLGFILGFFVGSTYKIIMKFGDKRYSLRISTKGLLYYLKKYRFANTVMPIISN